MSTQQNDDRQRQPASPDTTAQSPESPAAPPRQRSPVLAGADSALHECVGAICLVEVTLHSLEFQEIACPEQEVLKRALKAIWLVHDWIDGLRSDSRGVEDTDGEDTDDEDIDEEDTDGEGES